MKITYEVDDGYAGKSRPQHVTIDDDELREWAGEDKKVALEFISDCAQDDFEMNITWNFSNYDRMMEELDEVLKGE